jgi:hypothetical protein
VPLVIQTNDEQLKHFAIGWLRRTSITFDQLDQQQQRFNEEVERLFCFRCFRCFFASKFVEMRAEQAEARLV